MELFGYADNPKISSIFVTSFSVFHTKVNSEYWSQ